MKKGWQTKKLGDVCATIQDGAHESPQKQFDSPGEGRFLYITSKNIRTNYLELKNVSYVERDFHDRIYPRCSPRVGDVLLTKDGANTGNVALNTIDEPFSLLSSVCLIKTNPTALNSGFLCYYLQSPDGLKSIIGQMTGAAIKRIILRDVKLATIPLPPLAEQQRIVGLLDEAFEGLATAKANAEKNLQNARALFESHLQSVFTQHGPGWVETTLEEVLTVQPQNGWSPPAANHAASGTPVLTLSSVTGFVFRPDKLKYTSAKTDPKARYWIQNGDFLITRSNTPELVGHVAIASGIEKPTIYPDLIMRMNPKPDRALTEFLYYQLRTPVLRAEIMGRAQGANPTMKKISNGAVKTLPIAVPSIATQQTIVETLDALSEETQRLARLYERKLAALEALKKSLLHQAFAGDL